MAAIPTVEDSTDLQYLQWPHVFQMVPVENMEVDTAYQRPDSTAFTRRIRRNFSPLKMTPPVLSDRGNNHFAIIDGETKWLVAKQKNIAELPCVVFSGLTREQEAEIFSDINGERRNVSPYYRFRADLKAGRKSAVAINRIVNRTGFSLSSTPQPDTISSIHALQVVYSKSGKVLERALRVLYHGFEGLNHPIPGDLIRGLGYFLHNHENVDDEVLVDELRMTTPDAIRYEAHQLRHGDIPLPRATNPTEKVIQAIYENATGTQV